jgi:hypothetical protein
MGKVFGFIILILTASIIIYYLLLHPGINDFEKNDVVMYNSGKGSQYKILSMREIDSLTANLNYSFTIKNAVTHISRDSLKIPLKPENPSI